MPRNKTQILFSRFLVFFVLLCFVGMTGYSGLLHNHDHNFSESYDDCSSCNWTKSHKANTIKKIYIANVFSSGILTRTPLAQFRMTKRFGYLSFSTTLLLQLKVSLMNLLAVNFSNVIFAAHKVMDGRFFGGRIVKVFLLLSSRQN